MIYSLDALPDSYQKRLEAMSAGEKAWIAGLGERGRLPFEVTEHFAALAGAEGAEPLRKQFWPDPREEEGEKDPFGLADPLGEARYKITPRLVHQYRNRALLKTTGFCAGRCRCCFRRVWAARPEPFIGAEELSPVLAYLRAHREVRELLLSGGDPLTAPDDRLEWLLRELRQAAPGLLLRVCTRLPVTLPRRVDASLAALLARFRPLRIMAHVNHPLELSPETRAAFSSLVDRGVPVHVQTVLLQGVNDEVPVLEKLFYACLDLGMTPYYLFQLDLAPGTAHFRVPLKRGMQLYAELKEKVSPLALPVYALDLPGGGGKTALSPDLIAGEEADERGRYFLLRGPDGSLWEYPADSFHGAD